MKLWEEMFADEAKVCTGAVLRWGRGHMSPRFTCCPQIQKLAKRSDVISEVPKCSKIQIF